MADLTKTPLLDLDTLIERPFITIDGRRFEIRSPSELSVVESHRFGRWGNRIEALTAEDGDAAEAELNDLIARVSKGILIDVPDTVFDKLSGANRWAIIDVFTGLLWREKLKVAGAMTIAAGDVPDWMQSRTGASSSPGSNGFTEAARRTGFIASLRRWFGLI
ncbi:MAG: hypothetical protein U0975_09970 [Erythrobacter sp.]|nr:hypothetical protein [Erythrobacter sp.]MDZ4272988.1 hypothetical protein [Erythrobacter sp.]